MTELLIILWFSVVMCACSGFILGYLLGKARATKVYEQSMPKTVQELQSIMDENDILTKENIDLMKKIAELQVESEEHNDK